jgi:hypothetical protein
MKRDRNALPEIILRLTLDKPTSGIDFGLQKGRGVAYEVVQKQRSSGRDLVFEVPVTIKTGRDGSPDFAGPYVQGAAGERFFYIDIGTYAGQTGTECGRRLKVPISGTLRDIGAHEVYSANIPGTGKDGDPSCAYEWRKRVDPTWHWESKKR